MVSTHTQDRFKRKIQHLKLQIKTMEKQKPQVQKVINTDPDKFRKMEGQALLNRINKAIEGSKKDIKLMEMQI